MADPRFYDNRGPFTLGELCAKAGAARPEGADAGAPVYDVAGLAQAGPPHLSFFDHARAKGDFEATRAGWCLVREKVPPENAPAGTILIPCASVAHAFAAAARLFYPEHGLDVRAQETPVHPDAQLDEGVVLAPGVVVGPGAEIGARTRIGAHAVIGRGVTIGRDCEIGPNVTLAFAHLGDEVFVCPGARIGSPGFGFASGPRGHTAIPQLGRVIIQDRAEIGANTTIDRGALADTVIGEGTKIDNLVQIGHNSTLGRHCIMAGQAGVSGSVTFGDFVIVGGNTGFADHASAGDFARFAGMSGVNGHMPGGKDYGGITARPVREWQREMFALAKLARGSKRPKDE